MFLRQMAKGSFLCKGINCLLALGEVVLAKDDFVTRICDVVAREVQGASDVSIM
jgi:hypothetical protein